MKKKFFTFLLLLMLCLGMAVSAFAADLPLLVDEAGLLSNAEQQSVSAALEKASTALDFDVVVITIDGVGDMEIEDAAAQIFEGYHYGRGAEKSGVLLLVDMRARNWAIVGFGFGETAVNDDAIDYIADAIVPALSEGDFAAAFTDYAALCAQLVTDAMQGDVYKPPFRFFNALAISLLISFVVAFVTVNVMKGNLKSVAAQRAAADYVRAGSLQITRSSERYLYHTVAVHPKPQKTGSSGGGGGMRSHSGGHGRF